MIFLLHIISTFINISTSINTNHSSIISFTIFSPSNSFFSTLSLISKKIALHHHILTQILTISIAFCFKSDYILLTFLKLFFIFFYSFGPANWIKVCFNNISLEWLTGSFYIIIIRLWNSVIVIQVRFVIVE